MRQRLVSCSNCWFNGLQYGALGCTLGYCTRHSAVLRQADETTCTHQLRKDLSYDSALGENSFHARSFREPDGIYRLEDGRRAISAADGVEWDLRALKGDEVAEILAEYGEYGSKIESLAQLRRVRSARAELALLSLARGYVHTCMVRGGRWTSGLHLFRWVALRLAEDPSPEIKPLTELRVQLALKLERQVELAQWSLVMLRLTFLSDVGRHAQREDHPVGALSDLVERAAAETGKVSMRSLKRWVRQHGLKHIEAALPLTEYTRLARELSERPQEPPQAVL